MLRPGASSTATTTAGTTAFSGALVFAGAFEWASPCDLPGAAAAVEGPAIAAITATSAMIPDPRLPDFLFAISTSLSRRTITRAPQLPIRAHSVTGAAALRPPSEGRAPAVHSFEGSVRRRSRPHNEGAADRAQETEGFGISHEAAPSMAAPAAGRKSPGLFFTRASRALAARRAVGSAPRTTSRDGPV